MRCLQRPPQRAERPVARLALWALTLSLLLLLALSSWWPAGNAVVADALDLRPRELSLVMGIALLVLIAGIYPSSVLDLTRASVLEWTARLPLAAK